MRPRDCRRERLPEPLALCFEPLPDDPVVEALEAGPRPYGAWREVARRLLRRVVSDFDADGLLGTHPMALLGERSWHALVGSRRGGRLLDVGAGSGDVTQHARALFAEVVTTETSRPMARRLRARGFVCHAVDLARAPLPDPRPFDVVSLLNVLDRCERPRSLLQAATRALAPRGLVLISVPLPARPHVDVGSCTLDPDEPLGGRGETWEEALADLWSATLEPLGFTPERVARAPYVSRGAAGLHVLDAALLTLARPG